MAYSPEAMVCILVTEDALCAQRFCVEFMGYSEVGPEYADQLLCHGCSNPK